MPLAAEKAECAISLPFLRQAVSAQASYASRTLADNGLRFGAIHGIGSASLDICLPACAAPTKLPQSLEPSRDLSIAATFVALLLRSTFTGITAMSAHD